MDASHLAPQLRPKCTSTPPGSGATTAAPPASASARQPVAHRRPQHEVLDQEVLVASGEPGVHLWPRQHPLSTGPVAPLAAAGASLAHGGFGSLAMLPFPLGSVAGPSAPEAGDLLALRRHVRSNSATLAAIDNSAFSSAGDSVSGSASWDHGAEESAPVSHLGRSKRNRSPQVLPLYAKPY